VGKVKGHNLIGRVPKRDYESPQCSMGGNYIMRDNVRFEIAVELKNQKLVTNEFPSRFPSSCTQ
jgi:hypothetical protein